EDGYIYGRGTLDMKGPCAAFMAAAKELSKQDIPVGVILTTDEETTMHGAKAVVKGWSGPVPDFVLVCEPTAFRAMLEEKGAFHFTVTARGKPAHGSMPERGINALDAVIEVKDRIEAVAKTMNDTTVNLGVLEGGDKVNMVAQNARMELDVRFPPQYSQDDLEQLFFCIGASNGARVEFATNQYLKPWKAVESKGLELIKELAGGYLYIAPYATEAVIFEDMCPCAVFGPGEPVGAHEVDEYILLEDLDKVKDMYVSFVRTYDRV
ncbi:MAG TPA: M20 family peptidase, partial [Euryarchaeota archaeon]|nr:M20 family peptidase [Euryarchaeota archaeon]